MTEQIQNLKTLTIRIAVLVLAAGEGSRLGRYPKALLQRNGQSLLKSLCHAADRFNPAELLVVTGFFSDQVHREIELINQEICTEATWIHNPKPELGQASSVRLGLESLKSNYDVLLIALCDQPNVGAEEIDALLSEFARKPGTEILLPVVDGNRGNPVLFSKAVIEEILRLPNMVCRTFMDQHPERVRHYETKCKSYLLDVDTLSDMQQLGLVRT